ncbi:hypothetical protein ACFIOY_18325 [Bradyrhizobium sp. TZ2]
MDHRQGQSGIALLLSDRRQDANLAITDLKNGLVRIAVAVSDFDAMEPIDSDLVHFVGDRVIPVSSQAVDSGPDQEMSSYLLCCAEKLVMSLSRSPIGMHCPECSNNCVECLRFSNHRTLSFFSMRVGVVLIFFLSAAVPLNFFRVQALTAANPSGPPRL